MTDAPTPAMAGVLAWLHIGDLHLTAAGLQNHRDFQLIVALAASFPPGTLDFVVLPGDNADDGTAEQFSLVREALAALALKVHILPGDHDFKPRNLSAFYRVLGARALPYAETVRGHRCLFLDVVSAGTGGPDFRLGDDQVAWAEQEVEAASAAGQDVLIFMHTYPADLRQGGERLGVLLARPDVTCVDMGHTHYNELANDGSTIFMATRSTGQIEEGPPGFSVGAIDRGTVSWRFHALDDAWPFVLVTHPADRRLATRQGRSSEQPGVVRAKVLGETPVASVELQVDGGPWAPMTQAGGETALWQASIATTASRIVVRARDVAGGEDQDAIEPAGPGWQPPQAAGDGSDRDNIGAWPEKGIPGGQLGPNRNGRKW